MYKTWKKNQEIKREIPLRCIKFAHQLAIKNLSLKVDKHCKTVVTAVR